MGLIFEALRASPASKEQVGYTHLRKVCRMPQKRRSFLVFPLIILVCTLLGGFYGPRIQVAAAATAAGDDLPKDVESFTKAFSLVEQNFADSVSADKAIYKGAIPGMLRTLDPHSNFFDPKEYQALRDDQRGHYYGVGMTVGPRNGKTMVMAPFPGSPAYKAGLRPGDVTLLRESFITGRPAYSTSL